MHDTSDWMAQHFSTDVVMPCDYLLLHFKEHFSLRQHWQFSGVHYQKTSESWLARLASILHGMRSDARGNEWIVSRYLFRNSANRLKGGQAS
jgi:cyclopropane fatty-acyl-phospholipid synthase-like methyltransferase